MTESSQDPLQVPERMARELARLRPPELVIPESVDAKILSAARVLRRRSIRRLWPVLVRWAVPAAAAAVLVALCWPRFVAGDLDGNRRIDIVDAYLLALQLETGKAPDARHDLTGEGVVDGQDLERLSALAVQLR